MILSQTNLAKALREVVYRHFPTAADAAKAIDADEFDLRRAWGNPRAKSTNRLSYSRYVAYLDKLGYEVCFEIRRKQCQAIQSQQPNHIQSRESADIG